jgi:hypothetical protein
MFVQDPFLYLIVTRHKLTVQNAGNHSGGHISFDMDITYLLNLIVDTVKWGNVFTVG